ncbi:MAG: tetracycline resistance efflux pump [Bacillota bacterium]|nr:tetracycline resistance efflux pump [Bacillota bacterium]
MDNFGWLSILPPLVAITLAIVTREVLVSLVLGIFTGALILTAGSPVGAFTKAIDIIIKAVGDPEWNVRVLLFVLLLGGIVGLLARSGSPVSFSLWAVKRVKSRPLALVTTWLLGIIIFMDDYFNCLTVGTVMRPITDRYRVSRAKLAFIIDATAAPVCILVPLSTWVAYVISLLVPEFEHYGITLNPFQAFLAMVPYNLYAWLILIMVLATSFTDLEYGPMARHEYRALSEGVLYDESLGSPPGDDFASLEVAENSRPVDLVVPIVTLVVSTIAAMLSTGGYGEKGFWDAIMNTDSATSLVYGATITIIVTTLFYHLRRVVPLRASMTAIVQGFKSMMVAVTILALAWSIGAICKELGTGAWVAGVVSQGLPAALVPAALFAASAFIAFATGTSWGTFAIMLPIAVPLANTIGLYLIPSLAAVLAGGTFGDHCSPISDTTIMSSTGGACHHVDHVNTQLPYAVTAAGVALVGFLTVSFLPSGWLVLAVSTALFLVVLKLLHSFWNEGAPAPLTGTALRESEGR